MWVLEAVPPEATHGISEARPPQDDVRCLQESDACALTKMDASKPESQDVCAVNLPQMSNACERSRIDLFGPTHTHQEEGVAAQHEHVWHRRCCSAREERKDEANCAIAVPSV